MRDSENSPRRAVVRVTDQLVGPIQSRKPKGLSGFANTFCNRVRDLTTRTRSNPKLSFEPTIFRCAVSQDPPLVGPEPEGDNLIVTATTWSRATK